MSGRAGRRGLDARGVVIMMIDEKMEPEAAKNMVKGESDRMNSAFHLSYNMVLNLLRVEGFSPEYMLEKCFYTFQNDAHIPQYEQGNNKNLVYIDSSKKMFANLFSFCIELMKLEAEKNAIVIPKEEEIASYYELRKQIESYSRDVQAVISHPQYCLQFIQPGRFVHIKHNDIDFGWAVVLNFHRVKSRGVEDEAIPAKYIVDVLLHCSKSSVPAKDAEGNTVGLFPPVDGEKGHLVVVPVLLNTVQALSHVRLVLPKEVRSSDARKSILASMLEVRKRFKNEIPLLDPIENMNIRDPGFQKVVMVCYFVRKPCTNHTHIIFFSIC